LNDEWFFREPLKPEEFRVAVKERAKFEKIAFPKANSKNPLLFNEVNFCQTGMDATKYLDFICRGYYSEDKILVYKLAKYGFDSFSQFNFLIQDKVNYPSICNGVLDTVKNSEKLIENVDKLVEEEMLEDELENQYEADEEEYDSE
jgi:hypothetical protein